MKAIATLTAVLLLIDALYGFGLLVWENMLSIMCYGF